VKSVLIAIITLNVLLQASRILLRYVSVGKVMKGTELIVRTKAILQLDCQQTIKFVRINRTVINLLLVYWKEIPIIVVV
jgi:hypothetical protein